jgi:hypothetical protein
MEAYHKIVLAVAASVLLLYLLTVGFMMRRDDSAVPWPPVAGRCPDGWKEDATILSKCSVPANSTVFGNTKLTIQQYTFVTSKSSEKNKLKVTAEQLAIFNKTGIAIASGEFPTDMRKGDSIKISDKTYKILAIGDRSKIKSGTIFKPTYYWAFKERTGGGNLVILDDTNSTLTQSNTSQTYTRSTISFGHMTPCEKKNWVKNYKGLQWDGISNYNKCKF